jgi:ankyrin repeat protein
MAKYDLLKFVPQEPLNQDSIIASLESEDLSGVVRWIVTNRADINQRLNGVENKPTALEYAIQESNWAACCLLLSWSADALQKDSRGWSAIHYLAVKDNFSFAILLSVMRRINTDLERLLTEDGKDVLKIAEDAGNVKITTVLKLLQTEHAGKPGSPEPSPVQPMDDPAMSPQGRSTGVRHSLSRMFQGYPHIHRHVRNLVQQQYNYYHERSTRSRRPSQAAGSEFEMEEGDGSSETVTITVPSPLNSTPDSPRKPKCKD